MIESDAKTKARSHIQKQSAKRHNGENLSKSIYFCVHVEYGVCRNNHTIKMLTSEELEFMEPESKRVRAEDSLEGLVVSQDVYEKEILISSQEEEEEAEEKATNEEPKQEILDKIEEIEKLIAKLKEMYTKTPTKYEEALVVNVLNLLDENLN